MGDFFFRIYQFIAQRRLAGALALLGILAGLTYFASKIQFEEDISKLIPTNSKTEEIQKVLKSVNFSDKIIVNISRQPDASINELTQYAEQFLDSITARSASHIKEIQGKVQEGDISGTLDFVYNNVPLFLDGADYKSISQRLSKDSISAIMERNYRTLISPSGIVSKDMILKDPLGISFIALNKLRQLGVGDQFILKNGFVLSKDEQHILLFITPVHPSSETAENTRFVADLYEIQNNLDRFFQDKVKSEYFGATFIAVANAQQIKGDIQLTATIALTVLMGILILFYRKVALPIILFAPTLLGGLLSVAVLYWTRGKISGVSLGIGSVLIGVTLDYSLHILTQIRSNPSIKTLFADITKPVLMSSTTTALAFTCLLFLDSRALQDLGLFAAISVVGASLFALLLIPHLYRNSDTLKSRSTFLDKIAAYDFHRNKWGITLLIALLVMSTFTYDKVIFNKDITKLNYEPSEMVRARENLDALTDMSSKSIYLAVYGTDRETVFQANDSVYKTLEYLKGKGEILNFGSIGALVNSQKKQQEKIARWKSFWEGATLDSTMAYLSESGEKLGFKSGTFDSFHHFLSRDFHGINLKEYGKLDAIPLDDYIVSDNESTTLTTMVKLDETASENIKELFREHPNTFVIDRQEMNEAFLGNLKSDFNKLIGYSVLAVMLILFISFRSFSLTLVTGIPIFITWWITIGIMGALNIEFNIFNIIISTFIFGLGIDYSIFVTIGLLREYNNGEKSLPTQRTAILLSFITTVLGIGVLIFAKHPALYSISLVCIIGILTAVFVAFTIQPAIFRLFIGSPSKRPINLRLLVHSVLSFTYYGLGGLLLSISSLTLMKILPIGKKTKMKWFHKTISSFMKSVLYTNPFVRKTILNLSGENFEKPAILIANHTSFLDILAVGMLHPKIIYLVNDWVYRSPIFGKAVQLAGFYPVSGGIEKGLDHLRNKVDQGYSLMAFPEGTRSRTNKIRRFHKGAFYLAEQFDMDIVPILIHGNSEVLPKGTFVIRDGSITVKILDRITPRNAGYGNTSRERSKNIAAYFRKEFQILRNEIEGIGYFHALVLQDYRYKGDTLYRSVKKDLKKYGRIYAQISEHIGATDTVIHLSKDQGQLDFLLSLNSVDRKIIAYLRDESVRSTVKNSFITQQIAKLTVVDQVDEALAMDAQTLIINLDEKEINRLDRKIKNTIGLLILLKDSTILSERITIRSNFNVILESKDLIILKRVT